MSRSWTNPDTLRKLWWTMDIEDIKIVPAMQAFQCPAYNRYFRYAGVCEEDDIGENGATFQVYGPRHKGFTHVVYVRE